MKITFEKTSIHVDLQQDHFDGFLQIAVEHPDELDAIVFVIDGGIPGVVGPIVRIDLKEVYEKILRDASATIGS